MPSINPQRTSSDLQMLFEAVRSATERLCEPLETEDFVPQPIVDVSPPKWNIAHTTWFFEEMILRPHLPGYTVFNDKFSFLFNSYYNSVGDRTRRDNRGDLSRPTVAEVFEYRRHVDAAMEKLFAGGFSDDVSELVMLGINHEQQHQELFLTDFKYILSRNPLYPAYRENYALEEICEMPGAGFAQFESGIREIGYDGDGFCFDNELGRHRVFLEEFEIRKSLVTNAEYIEFIKDGGYREFSLWHAEGWDWARENEVVSPLYWTDRGGEWFAFTLSGLRPVNPDAPVCHVSFYEAAAFAEWKGARLATEFERETAAAILTDGLRWEWTNSAYLPYPGFSKAPGAVGEYNGKFMVNQMVLRGASVATPKGHSRPTYRNFFHPNLRWQFTGIRLAR